MNNCKTQARSTSEWSVTRATSGSLDRSGGDSLALGDTDANTSAPNDGYTNNSAAGDVEKSQNGRASSPIHLDSGAAAPTCRPISEKSNSKQAVDVGSFNTPPPAPPPLKSKKTAEVENSTLDPDDSGAAAAAAAAAAAGAPGKRKITTRMLDGSKRFVAHTRDALFRTWVNVLLVFVPLGIAVKPAGLSPGLVFGVNAVAIIPLAGLLAHATETVASRLGDTWGALLNVSFGNAVELIIFIIALVKNEISIVQAALLGSILANLLLILGMAFLLGGLRFQEQLYNNTVTQMSACLLSLSVVSLLLPTAFHASFKATSEADATKKVLQVSRGTSVVLLLVYILYLLFQLKSHSYLYESTPQAIIDEESHPGVLADIMNYSSSSDGSTTDDSIDSDSSGSPYNAGRRIKRAFRNRRHRKSAGSASSVKTGSVLTSLPSSPSSTAVANSYWDSASVHQGSSKVRRQSIDGGLDDGEADNEADHIPRVRDFVDKHIHHGNDKQSSYRKSTKKKSEKRHKKSRRDDGHNADNAQDMLSVEEEACHDLPKPASTNQPTVSFSEQETAAALDTVLTTRSGFNMRQFGRGASFRPALPKVLSQNVFVSPSPPPAASAFAAPPPATNSQSTRSGLRRISSMPERLNRQISVPSQRIMPARIDPLPPFHHQAARQHTATSETNPGAKVEDEDDAPAMSRTAAVVMLLITTGLVAVCAEFMVDAIPAMLDSSKISQAFVGLIILPIVSNAAEHVTAVTVATKNKMDLAIGVAVGSSIQIALFVTPLVVLLGWILGRDMSLYFNLFDTISLFVTAFVINFLILDGRSNYLEGSLLIAAYVIIALGAFFYPSQAEQSSLGAQKRAVETLVGMASGAKF